MNFTKLKNFLDAQAAERTPGNAVVVSLNGKPVYQYACGYSNLEEKIPLTGDELYNIYSCSKVATAVAGMQMLERGKFLLSDPLYDFIPEFKEMTIKTWEGEVSKAQNPIRIGDLFGMSAGFTYDLNSPGIQKAKEITKGKMDTVEVIRCLAQDPISFEPGSHFQYSLCHDVLAAVISVVSGKKFRDYVKENIFDPLDMKESTYHHTEETLKRTSEQYWFAPSDDAVLDAVEAQKNGNTKEGKFKNIGKGNGFVLGEEYDSGGAGIITSVTDYAKFTAALANEGVGQTGERILSKYAIDLMRTDRLTGQPKNDFGFWQQYKGCGYGLGVFTHVSPTISGVMSNIGEFGWGGAAGATVLVDPKSKVGVFYVQHTMNAGEDYYQPRLRNIVFSCLD